MPSKNALMQLENHLEIFGVAKFNHGIKNRLKFIRRKADGLIEVGMEKADGSTITGEGADRLEAFADCISKAFPE